MLPQVIIFRIDFWWAFEQKGGVVFKKIPKTGLFKLHGALFKSVVAFKWIILNYLKSGNFKKKFCCHLPPFLLIHTLNICIDKLKA